MYSTRNDVEDYQQWWNYGHQRDWFDRATDEVKSWFGDENARHRREVLDDSPLHRRTHRSRTEYGGARSDGPYWQSDRFNPYRTEHGYTQWRDHGLRRGWFEAGNEIRSWLQDKTSAIQRHLDRDAAQGSCCDVHHHPGTEYGAMESWHGRGPRNYKRADEQLLDEVCKRLTMDADVDAFDIDVAVKDGEVTLSGFVTTRNEKYIAEDLACEVTGVKDVHNDIKVQPDRH